MGGSRTILAVSPATGFAKGSKGSHFLPDDDTQKGILQTPLTLQNLQLSLEFKVL